MSYADEQMPQPDDIRVESKTSQPRLSKFDEVVAVFFACPVVFGAIGFVLGGFIQPLPDVRYAIHQAQICGVGGFYLGILIAAAWSIRIIISRPK